MHRNKICHRDLKPDNILVTEVMKSEIGTSPAEKALEIKVIDFNVAVEITNETNIEGATGLKEWSAPETRTKSQHSFVIDCWTLGCIMFLLCTGEKPFQID